MNNFNIQVAAFTTLFVAAAFTTYIIYIDSNKKKKLAKAKPRRNYSRENLARLADASNLKLKRSPSTFTKVMTRSDASNTNLKSLVSGNGEGSDKKRTKLVIVMVGLPGRGKTYVARKVARYLRWIDHSTMVFSLAKYRLEELGPQTCEFFNPQNTESYQKRVQNMKNALEDLISYLYRDGDVAILDGTNTSRDRRQAIVDRLGTEPGFQLLWIEMVSENQESLATWITENQSGSPEFISPADYETRVAYYRQGYSPVSEEEGSYIKMVDNGRRLEIHQIHGFLPAKVAAFVLNLHTQPRSIFLVRSGESEDNVQGQLGGDAGLSPRGLQFADALAAHLSSPETGVDCSRLCVWTSCLQRALQTAKPIPCGRVVQWQALRQIESGVCDGLTQEEVKTRFPQEFWSFQQDPLHYRYPRAENYRDVVARLEPLIFELEQQREPICVVAHQASLRCLYAYFLDVPQQEIPYLSIPLHSVTRLDPRAYVCQEKRVKILVPLDS